MHQPIIGITAGHATVNGVTRVRLNAAYVSALRAAGAAAVVLPILPPGAAEKILSALDGLVLSGGEDVDPARYDRTAHPKTESADPARDAWELALVSAARASRKPTLAICRGMQLLNVALGGTLVQDLASERPAALPHALPRRRAERVHTLRIEDGSRLRTAVGRTSIGVNSLHHQAPDRLAPPLRAVAIAPDGVIEGVETTDDWWVIGVQWHPEELHDGEEPWDANLFRAYVGVVRELSSRASTSSRPEPDASGDRASDCAGTGVDHSPD